MLVVLYVIYIYIYVYMLWHGYRGCWLQGNERCRKDNKMSMEYDASPLEGTDVLWGEGDRSP